MYTEYNFSFVIDIKLSNGRTY